MADPANLIPLTEKLLQAISGGDYETYNGLCSDDMTCFEPETNESLVEGKAFHKFYFDLPPSTSNTPSSSNVTMVSPHVRYIDETAAVVCYVRLSQNSVGPTTSKSCETRVWHKQADGSWKNVHCHRS